MNLIKYMVLISCYSAVKIEAMEDGRNPREQIKPIDPHLYDIQKVYQQRFLNGYMRNSNRRKIKQVVSNPQIPQLQESAGKEKRQPE